MALVSQLYESTNPRLTTTLTADLSVGAINAAQVFPAGTTFQEFAAALLSKVFTPTYTEPTVGINVSLSNPSEVGTTGVTINVTFNRGSINGALVGGIWQPATFQDFRAGVATGYTILGINNGTNTSYTSANAVVNSGSNTYSAIVAHNAGPQPKDSRNNNFSTGLFAGTISNTVGITGARRTFFGADTNTSAPTDSASIRALASSALRDNQNNLFANGSQFTINIPAGTRRICFAYPATLRDVTTIAYQEQGNANQINAFTLSTVSVNGANNFAAINYKVYTFISQVPFGSPATFNVTI